MFVKVLRFDALSNVKAVFSVFITKLKMQNLKNLEVLCLARELS